MAARPRRPHFAIRTIRNGRVRIYGRDWEPAREPCPPRFNGTRAAFALYWGVPRTWIGHSFYDERGLMNGIALWGSEQAYRGAEDDWPGPYCEDNTFKWEWWKLVHPPRFVSITITKR